MLENIIYMGANKCCLKISEHFKIFFINKNSGCKQRILRNVFVLDLLKQ